MTGARVGAGLRAGLVAYGVFYLPGFGLAVPAPGSWAPNPICDIGINNLLIVAIAGTESHCSQRSHSYVCCLGRGCC